MTEISSFDWLFVLQSALRCTSRRSPLTGPCPHKKFDLRFFCDVFSSPTKKISTFMTPLASSLLYSQSHAWLAASVTALMTSGPSSAVRSPRPHTRGWIDLPRSSSVSSKPELKTWSEVKAEAAREISFVRGSRTRFRPLMSESNQICLSFSHRFLRAPSSCPCGTAM